MVFLFKDRSDFNLIFLLLLSVALHFHVLMQPPLIIANESDGLLSYLLLHYIQPLPPLVLLFLFHTILLSQAIRLNILLSKKLKKNLKIRLPSNLLPERTRLNYIPAPA